MATPWGAIIGGALSLGSSIYGGIKASEATQRAKGRVHELIDENQRWYDRRYNEDATQRADAQRVLTRMSDSLRRRNQAAAGRAAVGGATEESVAAEKAAGNAAMAEAISSIAAQGEARKDAIEQQYRATNAELTGQLSQFDLQRAQNITQAASAAGDAAASMGVAVDDTLDKYTKKGK